MLKGTRTSSATWLYFVEGLQIPVHRSVMVTSSKYFAALMSSKMSDSNRTAIDLNGLTGIGVQAVVTFAYVYQVDIKEEKVSEILTAAAYLQMDKIVARCDTFLEQRIALENYLDILDFTEAYPQLICTIDTVNRLYSEKFWRCCQYRWVLPFEWQQLAVLLADDSVSCRFRIWTVQIRHQMDSTWRNESSERRRISHAKCSILSFLARRDLGESWTRKI